MHYLKIIHFFEKLSEHTEAQFLHKMKTIKLCTSTQLGWVCYALASPNKSRILSHKFYHERLDQNMFQLVSHLYTTVLQLYKHFDTKQNIFLTHRNA